MNKITRRNFIKYTTATALNLNFQSCSNASNDSNHKINNNNDTKKWAFAHYMAGLCTRQRNQTVDEWKLDILDAMECGIDGWQFNFGHYNGRFKRNIANYVIALKDLDIERKSFKFFPSFDCNRGRIPNENEIIEWFSEYYDHPNHFRLNGLPLLTVWQARDVGNSYFERIKYILRNMGMPITFIPWISTKPNLLMMSWLFNKWSSIDGFFPWVASQSSQDVNTFNKIASGLCKRYGKTLMAGHGYNALTINKAPRFVDKHAAEAITDQMMPLINGDFDDCRILNIASWNDFGEDHHITPHPPWGPAPVGSKHPVWCHIGYTAVIKYYLLWWKTGKQPIITNDTVAIFHLAQLAKEGSAPFPYNDYEPDKEQDLFYLTAILKEAGTIIVKSGNNKPVIFQAPSGISHWRTPSAQGKQIYSLQRKGTVVFEKTSNMQISSPLTSPWSWSRYSEIFQI
ncbi:MAG: glycoside hydrolase family 71 protein [Candidatus Thiodiazotropha sp. (ex Lucinoma borealis)]|nr:glycoside hydrolase family 71 protein [Candidatus Thiodiazotropha sp. (ex Lucinoma borealis)]